MALVTPKLPVPRGALIGRERELTTVRDILERADTRLLTLTGVGGGGKTRLALQIANELSPHYPRRTWLVELAAITDPALVPIAVAEAVELRWAVGARPLDTLSAFLLLQPSLLILDNCEHLIDACAAIAETLLAACPELRILATSREPLQIEGERQYRLPTLKSPDPDLSPELAEIAESPAVRLFITRAQDVASEFRLTPENAAIVARVCARLDGIPLAIELAAARVRVLGIEQILERLDDSFHLLTGGSRVAPTRQQTLRATLDWGDALLTEEERAVFRRLAIFSGEFTLESAEAVCASADLPKVDVLDVLTRLIDKSLVVVAMGDRAAWYRLLEPVRQYAMEQLRRTGSLAGQRAKHVRFYTALAEQAALELRGPTQLAWLVRLEREQGNLRNALEWAEAEDDAAFKLRLAIALVPFWEAHGHLTEGRRWLQQALARGSAQPDIALRLRALSGAGRLAFLSADETGSLYYEAEELHAQSMALAEEIGDEQAIATALNELGMVHRLQRDLPRSIACLQEALERFRKLDDEPGIALALLNLGATHRVQGNTARSVKLLHESLDRYQTLGDLRSIAIAQSLLAWATAHSSDATALEFAVAAIAGHARLDDRWFVTFDLLGLATILLAQERPAEAVRFLGAAQALAEALGSPVGGVTYAQMFDVTRALLTEQRFTTTWAEGYALSIEQAVAEAQAIMPSPPHATTPATPRVESLTQREREVARLLRLGYTDRQIAGALFIGPGTVGVHVHHILQKLGLRSRVQVAELLEAQDKI